MQIGVEYNSNMTCRAGILTELCGAAALLLLLPCQTKADDAQAAATMARNCLECHNGSDKKGGLDLTRRERAMVGGDSGAALESGKPESSLLLKRIAAGEMPPEGRPPVPPAEQAILRDWIAAGAKWAADPLDPFPYTSTRRAGYDWWSLQPINPVMVPAIQNPKSKIQNPIDQFVLQKLQAANLEPSPPADRRTLIRRLSFDLLGLPPTPEEVEAFLAD